jgi:VWFA-related protein
MGVSTARNRGGGLILSSIESKQNSVHFQNEAGPQQLAVVSGGVYYHNNNDFFSDLRSAVADGREYYLLAYTPSNGAEDGKYRKITVEVAGQQKGVVRAKDGYWAGEPARP